MYISGWADINFSYLIGGDGVVYEGRGVDWIPATALGLVFYLVTY